MVIKGAFPVRWKPQDGKDGADGKDAYSPYIGSNGNWYFYNDTTQQYEDSGRSATGDDGHSPYIYNGYWYEWNAETQKYENTYIKAKGDKGDKGDDGDKGDKGDKGDTGATGANGCIVRQSEGWKSGAVYRNDSALTTDGVKYIDLIYIENSNASEGWYIYQCNVTHTATGTSFDATATDSSGKKLWVQLSNMSPLYTPLIVAKNAVLKFAQGQQFNLMKDNKVFGSMRYVDGGADFAFWLGGETGDDAPTSITRDGKLKAAGCTITGDSTFEGTLNAVTGTFKTLQALNSAGAVKAEIGFNSSEGKLYFSGDMQHQGYDYTNDRSLRFLTNDLWCRGTFGALQRATMVVRGLYADVYINGIGNKSYQTISLTIGTSSASETYYKLPCYSPRYESYPATAGFAVDTIIFNQSSISGYYYRYNLDMADTQRVLLINGNDDANNIQIYQNGNKVTFNGGVMAFVVQLPCDKINPTPASSLLGRGIVIGAMQDNNWKK